MASIKKCSSHTLHHTAPTAQGKDSEPVVVNIPKAIRSTQDHFHLCVEAFRDAVEFGKAPHPYNRF